MTARRLITPGFLLVRNRAHLVNACAGDAIAFASMRSIGTTFRLAKSMIPVTIEVMGTEFPETAVRLMTPNCA
jgi:hypothetical protein